jgi:carbonic anhydrase
MQRALLFSSLCVVLGCANEDDQDEGHVDDHAWGYHGDLGPDHWGEIPGNMQCSDGLAQSPVALMSGLAAEDLPDLAHAYQPSGVSIVNNGHTLQYNYDPGSVLHIGGAEHELLQFHFHAPSEHTLDGKQYPMEVHFVHRSSAGALAVVGAFIEEGAESQALIDAAWDHLPLEAEQTHVDADAQFNALELLPDGSTFRYAGSLTTPPCSEGVAWHVFERPIQFSAAQIEKFTSIFQGNYRPVQPAEMRTVAFGN